MKRLHLEKVFNDLFLDLFSQIHDGTAREQLVYCYCDVTSIIARFGSRYDNEQQKREEKRENRGWREKLIPLLECNGTFDSFKPVKIVTRNTYLSTNIPSPSKIIHSSPASSHFLLTPHLDPYFSIHLRLRRHQQVLSDMLLRYFPSNNTPHPQLQLGYCWNLPLAPLPCRPPPSPRPSPAPPLPHQPTLTKDNKLKDTRLCIGVCQGELSGGGDGGRSPRSILHPLSPLPSIGSGETSRPVVSIPEVDLGLHW